MSASPAYKVQPSSEYFPETDNTKKKWTVEHIETRHKKHNVRRTIINECLNLIENTDTKPGVKLEAMKRLERLMGFQVLGPKKRGRVKSDTLADILRPSDAG